MKNKFSFTTPVVNTKTGKTSRKILTKSEAVEQQQMSLSQEIIPAVPGEYYDYTSLFTEERPLYVLMKCRANKARMVHEASYLGREISAVFQFNKNNPRILSVKAANALGLFGDMAFKESFTDIWFAPTNLTNEQFVKLQKSKKPSELVKLCTKLLTTDQQQVVTELHKGLVVVFMTSEGKYGVFLVEEITPALIILKACHTLI